jgi:hypothetical protein
MVRSVNLKSVFILFFGITCAFFVYKQISDWKASRDLNEINRAIITGMKEDDVINIAQSHSGSVQSLNEGLSIHTSGWGLICKFRVELGNGVVTKVSQSVCID